MQLEGFRLQLGQVPQKVFCPLKAKAAFPRANIDEKIVEMWRTQDAILTRELP